VSVAVDPTVFQYFLVTLAHKCNTRTPALIIWRGIALSPILFFRPCIHFMLASPEGRYVKHYGRHKYV